MRTCVAWLRSAGLDTRLKSKNSVGARSVLKRVSCENEKSEMSFEAKFASGENAADPETLDCVGDAHEGLHLELFRR